MTEITIALTAFGVVFIGELPDKTAVASLVMGSRYPPLPVLAGVWSAFVVHVVIACAAGGLVAALPRTPVEIVTAVLFLVGAVVLLRSDPEEAVEQGEREAAELTGQRGGRQIAGAAFGVVLVAEFGDLTQILTATLAARYHAPVPVGIGALLALWSVAAIAVTFGRALLRVVPLRRVELLAAVVLLVLCVVSLVSTLS